MVFKQKPCSRDKKNNSMRQAFLIPAFIIAVLHTLGYASLLYLVPVVFLMASLYLFLLKKDDALYVLFIVLSFTNGLILREYYYFDFLGPQQLVMFVAILSILRNIKTIKGNSSLANSLVTFLILYVVYTSFKEAYYGLFDMSYFQSFALSISHITTLSLIYFIGTRHKKVGMECVYALIVFLFFTSIYPSIWIEYGYYFTVDDSYGISRVNGFIGNGDANTMGLIAASAIGLFLNSSREKLRFLTPILICIALVALSASRAAFLVMLFVIIIYYFKLGSLSKKIVIAYFATILLLLTYPLFDNTIERIGLVSEEQQFMEHNTSNRVGKWVLYLNSINEDNILIGSTNTIEVGWDDRYLVAHNFPIQVLYDSGLIFLFYLVYIFVKIYLNKRAIYGNIHLIVTPIVFGQLFISDFGAIIFLILILSMISKNRVIKI